MMHNPKLKRELQVKPEEVSQWEQKGYVRGKTYGREAPGDRLTPIQKESKDFKTPSTAMQRILLKPREKKTRLTGWVNKVGTLLRQKRYSRSHLQGSMQRGFWRCSA